MNWCSCSRIGNTHYATEEEFIWACAEAMREEYLAITNAGIIVQMTAMGTFSNGQVIAINDIVFWSSSAMGVATVSNTPGAQGEVQGVTGTPKPTLPPTDALSSGAESTDSVIPALLIIVTLITITGIVTVRMPSRSRR